MITFTDNTQNPLIVPATRTANAFNAVTVADDAALSSTETVTVQLGPNYFAPEFGTISDPNGGGTYNAATGTFTENVLVGGSPTGATDLLKRLVYQAPAIPNGQGYQLTASVTVADGVSATDPASITIDEVTPPMIGGTVANEPIASGGSIPPFATILTQDYNFNYSTTVSASIAITDGGKATDADGLLTGPGLSKTGVGTYTLAATAYYNVEYELRALQFATTAVAAGQTANPNFAISVTDPKANLTSTDSTTSLLIIGPPVQPVAPSIAGTSANLTVAPGNMIDPFASTTISDANATPTDSVTITMAPNDGTLSGAGLTPSGNGIYTLAAAAPTTITGELDALTFQPNNLAAGQTSATTNFTLAVTDTANGLTATNATTSVLETAPPPPAQSNFSIQDETTGQTSYSNGNTYSGPVAGLGSEIILATSDNINVTATVPNVFIHTGSGEDAINVSNVNGNNVMDGSTGSNFLVGGTGLDQFYLDDRNAPATIWSTMVNFHAGDSATIWGITQAGFGLTWADGMGASGATGLTGTLTTPGQPTAMITLAGYTTADLSNGKLAISYGTTPDLPGLAGSNYMLIHGS